MIRTNKELLCYLNNKYAEDIEVKNFKDGNVVLNQDAYVKNVFVVVAGILKCSRYNDDGTEFILEFFGEGEILGEVETLLGNATTIAQVQAIGNACCYRIPTTIFKNMIVSDNEFNGLLLKELANNIRYKAQRYSFIQTHTLEQNLQNMEKENPNILSLINKIDLANYLGVTLRSLNRAIKNMQIK